MDWKKETFQIIFVLTVAFTGFAVLHEHVHKQIYNSYGCQAEIDYIPDPDKGYLMATTGKCPDTFSDQRMDRITDMQRTVEIVGYQLIYGFMITLLILVLNYQKLDRIQQQRM
jgi:hypothetical protein